MRTAGVSEIRRARLEWPQAGHSVRPAIGGRRPCRGYICLIYSHDISCHDEL